MSQSALLKRSELLPESNLPAAAELLSDGKAMAKDWQLQSNPFLGHYQVDCEYDYNRQRMAERRVMQHAQIGFRDLDRSCEAYAMIWEECASRDITVDRYGICLDWSMASGCRR